MGPGPIRTVSLVRHAPFLRKSSAGGGGAWHSAGLNSCGGVTQGQNDLNIQYRAHCAHRSCKLSALQHRDKPISASNAPAWLLSLEHASYAYTRRGLSSTPSRLNISSVPTYKSCACFRALEASFMFDTIKANFALFRSCSKPKPFSYFPVLKQFCMFYRTLETGSRFPARKAAFMIFHARSRFPIFLQ